jgi:capsular polysaccharide biosynthesis protein
VNRGYRNVLPAQMSFEEQVCAFSQATHVVGVLGAECANFAFSPRGIRFLGLAPNLMQDDFFWDLASLKGGAYTCLHGPAADRALGMNAPFDIDIALLGTLFAEFEAG